MKNNPFSISFTGADDKTAIFDLLSLSCEYPDIEWGVLYFPEKSGSQRNPSPRWRRDFAEAIGKSRVAAHLCGKQVFDELLDGRKCGKIIEELLGYHRVQVNINARTILFNENDVLNIYERFNEAGINVIMQYHADSIHMINKYLHGKSSGHKKQIHILFDGSKGRGKTPEAWPNPLLLDKELFFCGYAGGLGPETIQTELPKIRAAAGKASYWIDMESGVRTDNEFDLKKVEQVMKFINQKGIT